MENSHNMITRSKAKKINNDQFDNFDDIDENGNIFRAVVIYIPVGFILMILWGYIGVFVALTFSNIVTGFLAWLLSVYYFSRVFER